MPNRSLTYFLFFIILTSISCSKKKIEQNHIAQESLFSAMDSTQTGISFLNEIQNEEDFNIFLYRNFYNGGGVAIGDINNDGLPDVYLTANRKKNKLFLNKGDFTFEDITQSASVSGNKAWSTGVVLVDINADGLLDIYVCNAGNIKGDDQKNELFINNGDLTFTEKAEQYNLADSGFTTHAAFFDYDKDGDLDVYMLNNSFIPVASLGYENKRDIRAEDWNVIEEIKGGGDKLLRNNNGIFEDVSSEANIYGSLVGFGLGVTVGDINNDLYPDIYVSNDFFEHDYLYINNQDGTFTESIKDWANHLSLFSMGADMADINNDGKSDVFVTDMLPEGDERLKNTTTFETFDTHQRKLQNDYYYQYMQNTLQLNVGNSFSEVANYSGVSGTDWSWGALLFDMDNDGNRDIYVCNGIYHDLTNQDFIDFFEDVTRQQTAVYGNKEQKDAVIDAMPSVPISNYAFENHGDLTFSNASEKWGLSTPSFSNGAAYGDLDNDGDLDIIVNNVNQELFVYRNNSEKNTNNYLKVNLKGEAPNTFAVGSVVELFSDDKILRHELVPSRGFQSSVDYGLTIGLGKRTKIDSLRVIWPNDKTQILENVNVNTTISLEQGNATQIFQSQKNSGQPFLKEIQTTVIPHKEDKHVDFDYEGLISKMLSQEGPTIAIADVNNDGNEDVFVGGAKGGVAQIYFHKGNGLIQAGYTQDAFRADRQFEDTASAFIDVEGDGDMDLIVGSGGNIPSDAKNYTNRIYLNDGSGNFSKSPSALKSLGTNVSVIAPYDFDADGDTDLFIGSRSVPGIYGVNPEHLFLQNDGKGSFSDVTESKSFHLKNIGMVTDVEWADVDGDAKKDLVITTDWGAPKILKNNGRRLSPKNSSLDSLNGWWNTVYAKDLDNDGDIDLVLGNQGNNSVYKATEDAPAKMFINDFDDNGTIEQIVTRNVDNRDVPVSLKRELTNQLVSLKKQNLKFSDYATKSIEELLDSNILQASIIKEVNTTVSVIAINDGNGNFEVKSLPNETQFSCVCSVNCTDVNGDGRLDIILGGNNYDFKPQYSRLDASYGSVLLSKDDGDFEWLPYDESGFYVKGEIKHLLPFKDKKGQEFLFVGINNEKPKIYKLNE
ncbi:VCBS repeat-containing protein [Flagellimonas hymeniacidonis]|uniref:VCBS repeat-containing protein n=1 Tax=Flagellimonas hymeniacidonis TaxID=2603628 RepID=A0A5C8VA92_9FLAO|nr:VCBS repeat-containing protein [Flagellimonas hymeniacidonis]TXN38119.1 VCBS repeat-containing protein [Flagellimonas hymeniacidonis]